jgi:hypothetical protein
MGLERLHQQLVWRQAGELGLLLQRVGRLDPEARRDQHLLRLLHALALRGAAGEGEQRDHAEHVGQRGSHKERLVSIERPVLEGFAARRLDGRQDWGVFQHRTGTPTGLRLNTLIRWKNAELGRIFPIGAARPLYGLTL